MQIQSPEELISKVTFVGVALAGVLTVVFNSGVYTLWSTMVGAVLLLLLLSYSNHGGAAQTRIEHLTSSAVFALSSLLLLGWLLQLGLSNIFLVLPLARISVTWPVFAFALWLVATLFWMRVSPRQRWPGLFQTIMHH